MNEIYKILTLFFVALTFVTFGQDPVYSRNTTNPASLNPAFAGNVEGGKVYMIHRNQWPGLSTQYKTYEVGGSVFYDQYNSGIGGRIFLDDAANGLYQTAKVEVQYAYRLRFRKGYYLKAGIDVGMGRTQVDPNRFIFYEDIDPVTGPISGGGLPLPGGGFDLKDGVSNTYIDIGAGALLYNELFYAAFSLKHLNNPNNDFLEQTNTARSFNVDGLPMRLTFMGGLTLPILKRGRKNLIDISPQVMYTRQRDFGQLAIQGILRYQKIDLGLGARLSGQTPDAVIASLGLEFGVVNMHYAYDATISGLQGSSGGSHELGLMINFEKIPGFSRKSKRVDCLDMFR